MSPERPAPGERETQLGLVCLRGVRVISNSSTETTARRSDLARGTSASAAVGRMGVFVRLCSASPIRGIAFHLRLCPNEEAGINQGKRRSRMLYGLGVPIHGNRFMRRAEASRRRSDIAGNSRTGNDAAGNLRIRFHEGPASSVYRFELRRKPNINEMNCEIEERNNTERNVPHSRLTVLTNVWREPGCGSLGSRRSQDGIERGWLCR